MTTPVRKLEVQGIEAAAFTADAADPEAIRIALDEIRVRFGGITVLHWNAYGTNAGDVTTAPAEELRALFNIPVVGLATAVQAALPDLKKSPESAVLVTNGGLGSSMPTSTAWGSSGTLWVSPSETPPSTSW